MIEQVDLARLSRSQKQHLNLVLRHHAVALELVLNLVIAWRCGQGQWGAGSSRGNRGNAG